LKLAIRYASGARHEVELQGSVAILGRDPSCDLVLNDPKCSRRHAVLEETPLGLAIRDSGSANGVFVNGKRVERAALAPHDRVRLGDVTLEVIAEEAAPTLMMADEELAPLPPAHRPPDSDATPLATPPRAAPAPPRAPVGSPLAAPPRTAPQTVNPAPAPGAANEPFARPLTVTVLAGAWLALAVASRVAGAGVGLVRASLAAAAAGLLGAALGGLAATSLWLRAPWGRPLQIVLAALATFTCVFAPAALTVLVYFFRPDTRVQFSGRRWLRELRPDEAALVADTSSEVPFTAAILGTLALGVVLTLFVGILARLPFLAGPR
jgi:pSer/pThr/pTyr-binding forkhead associated (FHA) protein